MGHGKHHIGDFLPPDELERFMETFRVSCIIIILICIKICFSYYTCHHGESTVIKARTARLLMTFVKQEKFNNRWNRFSFDKIEYFGCSPSWPSEQLLKNPIFLFCFYTSCICRYLIGFNS